MSVYVRGSEACDKSYCLQYFYLFYYTYTLFDLKMAMINGDEIRDLQLLRPQYVSSSLCLILLLIN